LVVWVSLVALFMAGGEELWHNLCRLCVTPIPYRHSLDLDAIRRVAGPVGGQCT
jgi:hypothetical protein